MKKYDVLYIRDGKVSFTDTFDSFHEADYFANVECEGEWYEPDGKGYVLAVVPHVEIVNLTPHAITLVGCGLNGADLVILPSGIVARASAKTVRCGDLGIIPVTTTEYGEVKNLPDPEEGTIYIVSSLVAQRCRNRDDVFIPNESVRDSEGRIIGCKSLGKI